MRDVHDYNVTDNLFSSATLDPTPCAIPALHGIANAPTLSNEATETACETESSPTPTNNATEMPETSDSNNVSKPTPALATSTASSINLPLIQPAASASATAAETMPPGEKISGNPTPPETSNAQPSELVTTAEPVPLGDGEMQDGDVVMENPQSNSSPVSEPCLPQNDDNLPTWLTHNIEYLRSVSKEKEWQNLVTAFVTFEKSGPPSGVSLVVT
jgi:hypothetical protein